MKTKISTAQDEPRARLDPAEVEIDLLLYFIAVAEELSFTRAAATLGIDQSWLSHKIRQLEAKLEIDLFIRNTRHVDLTEAGRALVEPARRLRGAAQEARMAAILLTEGLEGSLRVGALPFSFRDIHRSWLVDRFRRQHPRIQLSITSGPTPALIQKVLRGDLDAAIVSAPFPQEGLTTLLLGEDKYELVLPPEDPLVAKPELTMSDLAGMRIVMPLQSFNPDTFAAYYQPFLDAGAVQVAPPEFQGAVDYALRWRLPTICKEAASAPALEAGFINRPLPGDDVICEKYLVRAGPAGAALEALWQSARTLNRGKGRTRKAAATT